MKDIIWVVLIIGSLSIIVVLLGVRMYLLLRILRILYEKYTHLYTKHYPADHEPDLLMTIKKGIADRLYSFLVIYLKPSPQGPVPAQAPV